LSLVAFRIILSYPRSLSGVGKTIPQPGKEEELDGASIAVGKGASEFKFAFHFLISSSFEMHDCLILKALITMISAILIYNTTSTLSTTQRSVA
jgi:hypothetical protein